ncbi:MbtH protein [Actinokineospora spheciospongiae]|uniref:MbtH protein n=1 Tax=Actinokineospora spheciospongiae TaxID=909613 RepID=W7ICJ8_9PSEU|nr:MbtH family protein [Actinokineospora spheciospongiae]EWC58228.1 MbtH protein [Actinokineospora spheciospongiae]PWW67010.1 MbtH protein [Actinokineospora spheciospongiae]
MTNPFDAPDEQYLVLVNHENQHSLWPFFARVPAGWAVTFGPDERTACLDHIERNWTDITPASARDGEAPR